MALGFVVATDIISAALLYYIRGKTLSQTTEDKPTLKMLRSKQKMFPSGNQQLSEPVQGQYMSDTPGFFQGYSQDQALNFTQAQNILRAVYNWKETHSGLGITWTELKEDGITVTTSNKTSQHSDVEATRLTGLMENRLDDFGESWQRSVNYMLWKDGTQDSAQCPGITALLPDINTAGTLGGLSRVTYPWWQHRVNLALVASAENQTLSKFLRSDMRQLKRYGGKPDFLPCGSKFIDALELEVQAKGLLTQEGFVKEGNTDIGMAKIRMMGVGTFEYEPTLDDLGLSNRAYFIDTRRLQLRPMQGEENKMVDPERPYNYMVFFRSITWTGALTLKQANANGVYGVTV
jgi:hypothetical protein